MSYCTLDDIKRLRIAEAKLVALTDEANVGVVDEETINGIISGAAEVIDGFMRGRYVLPMETVPGMIKEAALDICTYKLYALKPEFEMPKTVAEVYGAQMKILKQIQDGVIILGITGIEAPVVATASAPNTTLVSSGSRMFSEDVLKHY